MEILIRSTCLPFLRRPPSLLTVYQPRIENRSLRCKDRVIHIILSVHLLQFSPCHRTRESGKLISPQRQSPPVILQVLLHENTGINSRDLDSARRDDIPLAGKKPRAINYIHTGCVAARGKCWKRRREFRVAIIADSMHPHPQPVTLLCRRANTSQCSSSDACEEQSSMAQFPE